MDLQLKDKLALVTASGDGIGLAIAKSLAAEQARVIINSRTKEKVNAVIKQLSQEVPGGKFEALVANNSNADGVAKTIKQFPEVDILVNNLGIYEPIGFFEETDEDWQNIFETNIMSGVRLSRHYLKKMLAKNEGRIIFISSESGINPSPEMAHYSATKCMQLSISRSLAELTKDTKVTVNTVMPGPTRTPGVLEFIKTLYPDLSLAEAEKQMMLVNRPTSLINRLIDPQEIAHLTTFLCSPLASATNGAALRVEGGLLRSIT